MHELGSKLIRRFSAPAMALPPAMDQIAALDHTAIRPGPSSPPTTNAIPVRQLRDGAFVVRKQRPDPIVTSSKSVDGGRTPSSILHSFLDF
jgi:hypothetical protein